jgi:hypothetical protein
MIIYSYVALVGSLASTLTPSDCDAVYANAIRDYHGKVDDESIKFMRDLHDAIDNDDIDKLISLSSGNSHGFHGILELGRRATLRQRNLPQLCQICPVLGARNASAW